MNYLWGVKFRFPRINQTGNYMFKLNNRNTRTRCDICSKLKIKTPERRRHWRHSSIFIVNSEHISHLVGWERGGFSRHVYKSKWSSGMYLRKVCKLTPNTSNECGKTKVMRRSLIYWCIWFRNIFSFASYVRQLILVNNDCNEYLTVY